MLVKNYYTITDSRTDGDATVFDVALNAACDVYKGHFPETPVSPGVCNIQMLKECTEKVVGKPLILNYIQQCRLTTLVTPLQHQAVEVRVWIVAPTDGGVKIHATLGKGEAVYLDLKGEAVFEQPEK